MEKKQYDRGKNTTTNHYISGVWPGPVLYCISLEFEIVNGENRSIKGKMLVLFTWDWTNMGLESTGIIVMYFFHG